MAGVKLTSLRVTAEMDASGYARGVAVKTAADAQAIASSKALGAALAQQDAAMASAAPGMARLSRELVNGYGGGAQFVNVVERIGAAVGRGMGFDRAGLLLDQAYRKFGLTADAASLTASTYASLSPIIERLNSHYTAQATIIDRATAAQQRLATAQASQASINQRLGVGGGTGLSARDSADAFLASVGGLDGVARAKAEQIGQNFAHTLQASINSGMSGKSARDSAAVFQEAFSEQEKLSVAAANLRAKIDPVGAAFRSMAKDVADNNALLKAGVINIKELNAANQLAVRHFNNIQNAMQSAAKGGRLMSGEFANLGFQVNDVLTGIALGQSPFMIMAQQGGQVYQILANSRVAVEKGLVEGIKAAGRGFMDVGASIVRWMTLGRMAVLGVAGGLITATVAAFRFNDAQMEIQRRLVGAGRASGATLSGIEKIGEDNSSLTGLSLSESKEMAAGLAATGKIGIEAIGPIVAMGKDFARVYGVDAAEATKTLATAFSDPVHGAAQLNERLNAFSAATLREIENLVSQNRVLEAQALMADEVKKSMEGISEATSASNKLWTALGNSFSYAWDKFSEGAARATGLFVHGLDAKIANAQKTVALLGSGSSIGKEAQQELARLQQEKANQLRKVEEDKQRMQSVANAAGVDAQIPELKEELALRNNLLLLNQISYTAQKTGGANLREMGMTWDQVALAIERSKGKVDAFRNAAQIAIDTTEIGLRSVNATSPQQKAEIAFQQSLNNAKSNSPEAIRQAEYDRTLALVQAFKVLSDAERDRLTAGRERLENAEKEVEIMGRASSDAERIRAIEQARHNLEQEALRTYQDREQYDVKHLAALTDQINKEAQLKKLVEEYTLIRSHAPEISERESLQNNLANLYDMKARAGGEQGAEYLKRIGATWGEIALAIDRALGKLNDFKATGGEVGRALRDLAIAKDAIYAVTPEQRGEITRRQSLAGARSDDPEAQAAALAAKKNVILGIERQIQLSHEEQVVSARQSVEAANLELQIAGRSSSDQERARTALQAKHQLELEALRNYGDRDAYDKKHLDALTKEIELESRIKMTLAEQNALRDAAFERQKIGLPDSEAGIADKLRGIYGDDWSNQMNGAIAGQLRLNESLREAKGLATEFASGFVRDIRAGVPAMQALTNAVNRLFDKLIDAAINQLVARAFGGLLGSIGGGGPAYGSVGGVGVYSPTQFNPIDAGAPAAGLTGNLGPLYHGGGIVGLSSVPGRYVHPAHWNDAPRFHGGGLVGGEVPIIAKHGEGVFTREQMAAMGGSNVQVNVINKADGVKTEQNKRREGGVDIVDVIISTVNDGMANGKFDSVLNARHGLQLRARPR